MRLDLRARLRAEPEKRVLHHVARPLGIAKQAAERSGVVAPQHYKWLKEDAEYRQRFEELSARIGDIAKAHRKPRRGGYRQGGERGAKRDANQQAFLEALANTGVVLDAVREVGVSPATYYYWRRTFPQFAEQAEQIINGAGGIRRAALSERTSAASKARWDDTERRAAWSEYQRGSWTPEKRAEAAKRSRERLTDPDYRAAWREANAANRGTPEARARNSERMKKVWANPERREKYLETVRSPEARARSREAAKRQWAALGPEERRLD